MSKLSMIAIAIAALAFQPAFAADAPKAKAAAKSDCYEAATMPKAKSAKDRAAVKKETKEAMKAGEIPAGEAMLTKKK